MGLTEHVLRASVALQELVEQPRVDRGRLVGRSLLLRSVTVLLGFRHGLIPCGWDEAQGHTQKIGHSSRMR